MLEGSRIHEYAITTTLEAMSLDGWRPTRIQNVNVPLIATRNGKVRVAGHAAFDWRTDPVIDREKAERDADRRPPATPVPSRPIAAMNLYEAVDEYLSIGNFASHEHLRGTDMTPFYAAIKADLDTAAEEWRDDDWRVVQQYHLNDKGNFGVRQPDGLAFREREIWAVEATGQSWRRIIVYGMFDGVVLARYKPGQVFSPEHPPEILRQFFHQGDLVATT